MATYDPGRWGGRARLSGVVEQEARCRECPFRAQSHKNATALGAQHTDRTGHVVQTHQIISTTYGPPGATVEMLRQPPGEGSAADA